LLNALEYTLLIPAHEAGIRRFCLWAIGLAVLTLQKINRNPGFTAGVQVKVSRKAVAMTRISTDIALRNDWLLRRLFAFAARGLPLAVVGETRRPVMTAESVVEQETGRALRRSMGSSAT
jgi:farnesyl-diphosphate farnesyltransferase